jgi:cytochrome b subunit of formate dehydrogenase
MANPEHDTTKPGKVYIRFDRLQRIEHFVFLVSFSLLGLTGLIQKYSQSPISQFLLRALGGIETTRMIHHTSAFVMMLVSIYHLIMVLYRVTVLRVPWTMMPVFEDFKHLFEDVMYYLGQRKHKAFYGRYNYGEKVEYLAVVWGTIVMGLTGFMMWNPIATTRFLPGEIVPAAKSAHGAEAVLAVLAIVIWHFYNVHISHLNKSIFTGKITDEEMAHEHPAELAQIKAGEAYQRPAPEVIRRRKKFFFPFAAVIAVVSLLGVAAFISIEDTAITTLPPKEVAEVFVPITPTPKPISDLTPTPTPQGPVAVDTWDGKYSALFRNRCSTCHGFTKVGGLSLATYKDAMKGGKSGPGIVREKPQASMIVKVQQKGGHPGQLSDTELQEVISWIEAGAPER